MFAGYRAIPVTRSAAEEYDEGLGRTAADDRRAAAFVAEAEDWLWNRHCDFRLTPHPKTGLPWHRPLTDDERREIEGGDATQAYIRVTAEMVRVAHAAPAEITTRALGLLLGIGQPQAWRIRAGRYDKLLEPQAQPTPPKRPLRLRRPDADTHRYRSSLGG